MNIADLAAEFPRDAVSWRAQSVTKDGAKAMALAYIDARDVMDRLDTVCGPAGWQDRYEFHGPRTICYLSIKIGDEWITKADGAGDSDVEAEKGAISDALKRAAVKWGIGRYLYAIETPWVPCETYESNGKKHWKRWSTDPWSCVRNPAKAAPASLPQLSYEASIRGADTLDELKGVFDAIKRDTRLSTEETNALIALKDERKLILSRPIPKNLGEQLDRMAEEAKH